MQDRRSQPYAAAPYEPAAPAVWPARKVALGVASLFGVAALAVFGCSPASPARSLTLPRLELPFAASKSAAPAGVPALPGEASARPVEQVAPLAAAPAPADAPAVAPAAAEPAAMPIAAAPAVRTPWQPPDVPRRLYRREIEHWRPLVRQLIAELWSEGRMDGAASRLDDDLVLAIIQQESGGDPDAYSWAGAIGLMQVMPFTFAEMMAGDRAMADQIDPPVMFDVPSNMRAGLRYLALAMNAHEGNYYWAIASYNAGIEAVDDWRAVGLYAVPPLGGYEETANYAQVILRNYIRHRPDVAGQIHVPDPMPYEHVPGAIELLVQAGRW